MVKKNGINEKSRKMAVKTAKVGAKALGPKTQNLIKETIESVADNMVEGGTSLGEAVVDEIKGFIKEQVMVLIEPQLDKKLAKKVAEKAVEKAIDAVWDRIKEKLVKKVKKAVE
ncbi:MAG: hypothetical protein ACFFAS_09975 [Promethearchaeota archaeon]